MTNWEFAHIGFDPDEFTLDGHKVLGSASRSTGERVMLPHPSYPSQMHNFSIYEYGDGPAPKRFAVAELSAGVYGIYVST